MRDRAGMLESSRFVLQTLEDEGRLSAVDRRRAVEHAASRRQDPAQSLLDLELLSSRELALTRAAICEYPFVDLDQFEVSIGNARLLPRRVAERVVAFPLFVVGPLATVGMVDPLNLQDVDQVRQALKLDVNPALCDERPLRALIQRAYSLLDTAAGESDGEPSEGLTTGDEPIVAAVNQIIATGLELNASDIHLSPDEGTLQLRYRLDGALRSKPGPSLSVHQAIVQRLKVMAKLDMTQTRRPQDGKFRFTHNDRRVDVRLSLIPTVQGENVVMRLLRPAATLGSIADLAMPEDIRRAFEEHIQRPNGIILVTGPTGSGKTTTLYTAVASLNAEERNIVTIEDPVEIRLPGVRQVQVNHEIGLDFAASLRSVLRQDPDVILVGEIRDAETARIAVQAALTGHLVFSTLHTNDSVGSISRLRDFGVPAFAINNALLCAMAQRLVRRVCQQCAVADAGSPGELAGLGLGSLRGSFVRGRGCAQCMHTGVRGRVGVYELFQMTRSVHPLIEAEAPQAEVRRAAASEGFRPMIDDGLRKAALGLTTVAELAKLRALINVEPASTGEGFRLSA